MEIPIDPSANFSDAIANGAGIGAQFTGDQDVANFFQAGFAADATRDGVGALADTVSVEADNAERARRAALQQEIDDLNGRLDPGQYTVTPTDSGGLSFTNGAGEEVSARDYAALTGQTLAEVLRDSNDPNDIQFVQDYNDVNELVRAMVTQDTEFLAQLKTFDPDRYEALIDRSPEDIRLAFQTYYGSYYGLQNDQTGEAAAPVQQGSNFAPNTSRTILEAFPDNDEDREALRSRIGQSRFDQAEQTGQVRFGANDLSDNSNTPTLRIPTVEELTRRTLAR